MMKHKRIGFVLLLAVAISCVSASILKESKEYYEDDYSIDYNFDYNGFDVNPKEWEGLHSIMPMATSEDAHLKFVELVTKYGYSVESYYIETPDGYILNVHRIPHGKDGPPAKKLGVAFVQHGILSSSIDWIIPGPEKGLGYILADRGYDVWFGNARGNTYSRNHSTLNPEKKAFWDFSWHEIGRIDLPTMIDFVLDQTGETKLHYVGHSQGTTSFYVMASTRPEYNAKIRAQFSLAPIAYSSHMTSPLFQILARAEGGMSVILKLIGLNEFLPTNGFLHKISKWFCKEGILQPLCSNALFAVCGFNPEQFNVTLLPILLAHTPAGSSTKQFLHYAQLINSGGIFTKSKFRFYNYGFFVNKERYGQYTPPEYPLNQITAPVYLFYSHNDWLAAKQDVERLHKELGNAKARFLNPDKRFNHLDYLFGVDARHLVYEKVMNLMDRH